MIRVYHGSNVEKAVLDANTFVTKSFKDACKFGYRKAALLGSEKVFVHIAQVEESTLIRDITRDRSFILTEPVQVTGVREYSTFETPYKLRKFTKALNTSEGIGK